MDNRCPHHRDQRLWSLRTPVDARGCMDCSGLWLPGAAVAAALGTAAPDRRAGSRATTLGCPDDGHTLGTLQHRGVEIDTCPSCGGVWLDHGELERVLALAVDGNRDHDDDDDGVDVGDAIEALFDRSERDAADSGSGVPGGSPVTASTSSGQTSESTAANWQLEPIERETASGFDVDQLAVERDDIAIEAVESFDADSLADGADVSDGASDVLNQVLEFLGGAFDGGD